MKLTLEQANKIMKENGDWLDLRSTPITSLPDNLTVAGSLDLSNTPITSLPDNLTVGDWLDLRNTPITSLPDNLTVGGNLYLNGTQITSLPDNLTVSGSLDLNGTQITSLPDNLTVGGWLHLSDTPITSLPDNLTVGGGIYTGNRTINTTKVKRLQQGDYVPNNYLYADGILTHIKSKKQHKGYTYYTGKIKGNNVIFDGTNYAHCKTFKDGVADLAFKAAKDRGADQYKGISLDSVVTLQEAITMYRIITGACRRGTDSFVNGLQVVKDKYTVQEMIDITKGAEQGEVFEKFMRGN